MHAQPGASSRVSHTHACLQVLQEHPPSQGWRQAQWQAQLQAAQAAQEALQPCQEPLQVSACSLPQTVSVLSAAPAANGHPISALQLLMQSCQQVLQAPLQFQFLGHHQDLRAAQEALQRHQQARSWVQLQDHLEAREGHLQSQA